MGGVHRPAVPRPGASHHGRRERVGGAGDRWAPLEDGAPRLPGGLLASVTASDGVRQQFTTLFDYGVFDLFPRLKVLVLESGGGWLGYWLDRIDAVYGHTFIGDRVPLEHKPSDYVREQVWISCDPDERTIPHLAERFGADRSLWASDFPHADHTAEYVHDLNELVASFPAADRAGFIGGNARKLFDLPAGRG